MTLTEFIKAYNGKKVDFDGRYGAQCVDLYRQYCSSVLQVPQSPAVEGAKDIFKKPGALGVTAEAEKAAYVPGDVLVWDGTKTNKYGHVAILVAVFDEGHFVVLEQDGFAQDGVKLAFRGRDNLLGALWKKTAKLEK